MKLAEELRGEPLSKTRSFGSSDARFFAEQDIPTIVMRPTGGGAHSADEWIDEAALGQFYELLKVYVKEAAYAKA
jgi:acetylornithine deacetylase/succinyl-diaminopimelate desuccinylase-like protein